MSKENLGSDFGSGVMLVSGPDALMVMNECLLFSHENCIGAH